MLNLNTSIHIDTDAKVNDYIIYCDERTVINKSISYIVLGSIASIVKDKESFSYTISDISTLYGEVEELFPLNDVDDGVEIKIEQCSLFKKVPTDNIEEIKNLYPEYFI